MEFTGFPADIRLPNGDDVTFDKVRDGQERERENPYREVEWMKV